MKSTQSQARKTAFTGILSALALLLGIAESLFPPLSTAVPGIKPGFSNIVILFTIECISIPSAVSIALIKSLFVFVTRGMTAGILSLSGGLLATLIMALIYKLLGDKMSCIGVSVIGAVMHNIGQLSAAALYAGTAIIKTSLPYMLLAGVVMGITTGLIYKNISGRLKDVIRSYYQGRGKSTPQKEQP